MDAPTFNGIDVPGWMYQQPLETEDAAPSMEIATIGIDLARNVFQIHCTDRHGKVVLRRQLRPDQAALFFANLQPCLVGIEACGSAYHWATSPGLEPASPKRLRHYYSDTADNPSRLAYASILGA